MELILTPDQSYDGMYQQLHLVGHMNGGMRLLPPRMTTTFDEPEY